MAKPLKLGFLLFGLFVLTYCRPADIDIYLLIGQSNMAGRGLVEAQDTVPFPRVFSLTKENTWRLATDPIHFDKSVAGVGLGRTFGIEMAKHKPSSSIYLVPCAVGGSSISQWQPGAYHEQTRSYPWDDTEKRLRFALQTGTLKGILWLQGESDSNPEKSDTYGDAFKELIHRIFEINGGVEVPVLAGELGPFFQIKNKNQYSDFREVPAHHVIQQTQQALNTFKQSAFILSQGLHHIGDSTHFDAASQRILGRKFARAMIGLSK
ncbi:sialate O-acetylesterase [bacterium]|nr:MAG: sialate O-acetylesterase [bacterium]